MGQGLITELINFNKFQLWIGTRVGNLTIIEHNPPYYRDPSIYMDSTGLDRLTVDEFRFLRHPLSQGEILEQMRLSGKLNLKYAAYYSFDANDSMFVWDDSAQVASGVPTYALNVNATLPFNSSSDMQWYVDSFVDPNITFDGPYVIA